jgi:hypothetical protein
LYSTEAMPKSFCASAAACSHGAKYGCGPPGTSAILLSEASAASGDRATAEAKPTASMPRIRVICMIFSLMVDAPILLGQHALWRKR